MISVNEPLIGKEEIDAVVEALQRGEISGSFGKTIPEFEEKFAAYSGCKHGIAVSNGTTALHLATAVLDIQPGDEILVSASTNIATALGVHHLGGVTIPVDSENETWNMDLNLIRDLITSRTRGIITVHLFGHPVDMDELMKIADRHGLPVIEDCAESHGATCRGRKTGSFGKMSCYSFYANKILTTGEGGMVVTNDDKIAFKLREMRNLAFGKPRFLHSYAAYNFRMTGYQAAMGLAQLSKIEKIIEGKRRVAALYNRHLKGSKFIQTPAEKNWAKNVYWMYAVALKDGACFTRDQLMDFLAKEGIETRTFFCPMNQQPFLRERLGSRKIHCPVADRLWLQGLYLPSTWNLNELTIEKISSVILNALK